MAGDGVARDVPPRVAPPSLLQGAAERERLHLALLREEVHPGPGRDVGEPHPRPAPAPAVQRLDLRVDKVLEPRGGRLLQREPCRPLGDGERAEEWDAGATALHDVLPLPPYGLERLSEHPALAERGVRGEGELVPRPVVEDAPEQVDEQHPVAAHLHRPRAVRVLQAGEGHVQEPPGGRVEEPEEECLHLALDARAHGEGRQGALGELADHAQGPRRAEDEARVDLVGVLLADLQEGLPEALGHHVHRLVPAAHAAPPKPAPLDTPRGRTALKRELAYAW